MKALILAAGVGKRLKANVPKILLKVGNKSLLERHYENLLNLGIKNIGIVIGYKSNQLTNFIKKIDIKKNIKIFRNSRYKLGSIVSLVCAGKFFHTKGDLIFMDGDVFYDKKVLKKLINSKKKNCLLIDRQFEKGEEPVKVCIKNNKIFDFGKIVNQDFDFQGESVGFFKFSNKSSIKLLEVAKIIMKSNKNAMYEDVIQQIIKKKKVHIGFENITSFPWVEIDFKKDLILAKKIILKQINE
jgi:choline kinase